MARFNALKDAFAFTNQTWICGKSHPDGGCGPGPDRSGNCRATRSCTPNRNASQLICGRTAEEGGRCQNGPNANGSCGAPAPACQPMRSLRAIQRGCARHVAMIVTGSLAISITFAGGTKLLMPGPMATPHGSVAQCNSCHSGVRPGPMGWVHTIFAASDPRKDSMACLTCHKIGTMAVHPHNAPLAMLERATNRMQSTNTTGTHPIDRLRESILPVSRTFSDGVFCQTCHKEHKGEQFDLKSMPDNRCQACHTLKIRSFGKDHPGFGNYPFKRRTRIFFDHASHFGKHFPDELAKQTSSTPVPKECSSCHTIAPDNRHMDVKPFKQACSACHLGQIVGSERPEGPKGIALLALPGLDVETLEDKGIDIGHWPAESDAEITPFMELLIGRDTKRKKILAALKDVDLIDLSDESDEVIAAVQAFVYETKDLIHTYSISKPSAVLNRLNVAGQAKISPELTARLIASMPRDVLMSAQRQWLPNLGLELKEYQRSQSGDDKDGKTAADLDDQAENDSNADDEQSEPVEEPQLAVDAETWTEFGGWYRQDYSILYKPTGHRDEFLKAWLDLSGRLFSDAPDNPAAAAFKQLTAKNAQGQCTKCHSVDAASDGTRHINWMPFNPPLSTDRFTEFSHSPHLSIVGNQGCLTCHKLDPTAKNQATYEKFDATVFDSNFLPVEKKTCSVCHKQDAVRNDCLLCHDYHANPVTTPVPVTTLPGE